jgi:hypothetical protein
MDLTSLFERFGKIIINFCPSGVVRGNRVLPSFDLVECVGKREKEIMRGKKSFVVVLTRITAGRVGNKIGFWKSLILIVADMMIKRRGWIGASY